jgi:hypothetical protein
MSENLASASGDAESIAAGESKPAISAASSLT